MNNPTNHLSTNTPASDISSTSFDEWGSSESTTASLDNILRNSPAAAFLGLGESLPEEDEVVPAQDESAEEVPEEDADGSENDADEGDQESKDDEDKPEEDEESTPEGDLPAEDDIDWTYKIPVKIDGEVKYVTLEEARKGYATDQHLTSKGQQLGELKKQIEQERTVKLQELVDMGALMHSELTAVETSLQAEYNKLSADIEKAREDGDSYAAREAKDAREVVQEKYWKARNSREEKTKAITEKMQAQQAEQQQVLLKAYGENITKLIPDYSEKVAKSVRDFALKEGIPAQLLESIYDPTVVKFINDYRKLKTAKDTGEAKRKVAPVVKSVPTKSGKPSQRREQEQASNARTKVLSGQGSNQDQLEFLKRLSSVSKKL
jgi:hypothetical protein